MGLEPWRPIGSYSGGGAIDSMQRKLERGLRSVVTRLIRAAGTFFGLIAALIVYNMASGWMGFLNLLGALVLIVMASIAIMFLPVRDKSRARLDEDAGPVIEGKANVRLDRLAKQTESWLLERCRALPSQASGSLDRIVGRLRDLQAPLAGIKAESPLGGEAHRLIGQHLPSLVTTYLSLPPGERGFHDSTSTDLAESLRIVADRMDELCERVAHEKRMGFETERRFIDSRYGEDERLRSER